MRLRTLLLAAAALTLPALVAAEAPKGPRYAPWGVALTDMDASVKPGDDFYLYVNGAWDKRSAIPADKTYFGVDTALVDEAEAQVRAIAEEEGAKPTGAAGQKIADLYASFMDEAAIEKAGTAPLKPYLGRIAGVKTKTQLVSLFQTPGYASPMSIGIIPGFADPTHYVAYATQSGLGLPNRDYYILPDAKYVAFRTAYKAYIAKMLTLAGFDGADARAEKVMALETAMATSQWTPERDRDIKQINNPMDRAQLAKLAPQFDWTRVLGDVGLGKVDTIIAIEPSAITDAGKLVDTTPMATWQDYLAFHFVSDNAQFLPNAFDQANFDFFSKNLRDVPQQRARWKRGVRLVNGVLGEAVGQVYVARHYPPESDRQMGELIGNLRAAYGEELKNLKWMDDATRTEALTKLDAFDPRVGHPSKYIDYTSYQVVRGDPLGNAQRAGEFGWQLQLSRLPKPVDRTLWGMNPQEVNAYYDPSQNQITFPAAILQAPYFDPAADPAVNYGGIGATIGHEMGHGFDDQGRQFDASGKVRDWWTKASGDAFVARTKMLGTQFDGYEPVPGTHIKGELTMGENVGDLGGLEMAWGAWQRYKAQHGDPGTIGGYTSDQRFLIAYAYSWQGKTREGALREQILSDPHSPNNFRVNGIVRNFDPWYAAFNVKPGDKLYLPPEQRVHIWVD